MKSRTYELNIVEIGGKKFIRHENRVQCAYCLFVQPSSINEKWIKDKSGCYTHGYLKLDEEDHSKICKQNAKEKR